MGFLPLKNYVNVVSKSNKQKNFEERLIFSYCAADFSLLNLPKGKSLGRSKPATNS
jgi:hypothetical protein